jgi:putative heme-binding domain-containing protein
MGKRPDEELGKLLGHADQRVRYAAQFELVKRGEPEVLAQASAENNPRLMRVHGIWGLAQLSRSKSKAAASLPSLAQDKDLEVRAQWAKFIGETGRKTEADAVIRLLADDAPRVRFFAAQALGKLGLKEAVPALIAMRNLGNDSDPYVRHAAAVSLAVLSDDAGLVAAGNNESAAIRTVALLALRRKQSKEVARFLEDKNPQLVVEAARAIHDGEIPAAWPQLAALTEKRGLAEPVLRRAVNANYLLGTSEAAKRLAKIGGDSNAEPAARLDALQALGAWNEPFRRDRVNGLWRKLSGKRDTAGAVAGAARILPALLREPSEALRLAALEMAGTLKVMASQDVLLAAVGDKSLGGNTRAAAIRALAAMDSPKLADAVKLAVSDKDKPLLEAARQLAAKVSPLDAVKLNAPVLEKGTTREKQEALATIAAQPVPEADAIILAQLDRYTANKLPAGLRLDVIEAAEQRNHPEIKRRLAEREALLAQSKDPLIKWRDTLEGGNSKLGREIFTENAEAACMRCHKWKGDGGDVGPDLAKSAQATDRALLLESIIDPSAKIAPGYDNVLLTLKNGEMVAGILNKEVADEVTLINVADGKKQQIKTEQIQERMRVPSAMPPGLADVLGKRNLRDLIEFMASARSKPADGAPAEKAGE